MKRFSQIIFILFVVVALQTTFAQGPPPPPDGGGGDGTVTDVLPINSLIYPLLILGAYLGYVVKKRISK